MRIAEAVAAISQTVAQVAKRAAEASAASFKQSVARATAQPIIKGVAAGQSLDRAGGNGVDRANVVAQLTAAGYTVQITPPTSDNGDVRKTVITDPLTGVTYTEYYDLQHDNYTTEVTEPGSAPTSSPMRDGLGRKVTTSFDAKTGAVTTRTEDDLGTGTVVETTRLADGTVIEKTTLRDGTSQTVVTAPNGSKTNLLPGQVPTRDGTAPILADITAGKSIDQIASERGLTREQVIAQLKAAGYEITSTTANTENGTSTTAIRDPLTGKTITEHDYARNGTHDVSVTDASGQGTTTPVRDSQGRKITTTTDAATGGVTTRTEDDLGNGTVVETTVLPDGTTVETTTAKGSKPQTVVTAPDGKKTVLADGQTPTRTGTQTIVQDLAQGKSIEQIAQERGWTPDQVRAQLAAAGLEVSTTEPTPDATSTTVTDKHTGKVIASHRADYRHGTENTHYVDAQGNDVTRTQSTNGTVRTTVVSPSGRKVETTTTSDGKTTTAVTYNGYTLTTAPDGNMTLTANATGVQLQIKKGSMEAALATTLLSIDPNSSDPKTANEAKVVKSLIEGLLAGETLPELLRVATQAGIDKDALIAKYGFTTDAPGIKIEPTLDGQNNVIDPYGKPPTTPAPSGGVWVAMNVDGTMYWVDSAVAKAINAENDALTKLGQAQSKAAMAQNQLDVYLLDPSFEGAVDGAQTTINRTLNPFDLEWRPKKPEGTLAEAQARLAQANTLYTQFTAARGEYEKAGAALDRAIASGGLKPVRDPNRQVAYATGSYDSRQQDTAQDLADNSAVQSLFADLNVHMSRGNGLMGDSMITLTGTAEAPETTLAPGEQAVPIAVGGRTLMVAPDVARNYQQTGNLDALTAGGDNAKKVGIEIEVTNPDGTKTKQLRWVDPNLALYKIQSDSQIEAGNAYASFYRAHALTSGVELQEEILKHQLYDEYMSSHQFLLNGEDQYTNGGEFLGKFQYATTDVRDGQLWIIIHFDSGKTREQQLTFNLDSKRVNEDYRDRPLNQDWQGVQHGTDPRLCGADGIGRRRATEAQAGVALNDVLHRQMGITIADLDRRITGLHGEYLTALTNYGPGSLTPPQGALPPGVEPVTVDVGNGVTIKVAPDVAARVKAGESLIAIGAPVFVELEFTREDGSKYKEGRWVDPHVAVLQLQQDALQAQRTAMGKLDDQIETFGQWHNLRATHPDLLDTENSTVEATYLADDQAAALNSIYQPRFQSLLGDDTYANTYKRLPGRQLDDTVAQTLGLDRDSGAVQKVVDEIHSAGGDNPEVRVVPIFYVDDTVGTQQTALFAVKDGDKVVYVDANGQTFDDLKDFQDSNRQFSEHGKLIVPTNLEFKGGTDGKVALDVVQARYVSTMDKIVDPVIGIASGLAAVLGMIPTPASPFLLGAAAVGGGYLGVRAVVKEGDYLAHGGELLDGESLMNLGMVATIALPEAASIFRTVGLTGETVVGAGRAMRWWEALGATKGLVGRNSPLAQTAGDFMKSTAPLNLTARRLDWGAIGVGVPLIGTTAHDLGEHGGDMTSLELWTALTGLGTGVVGTAAGVRGLIHTMPESTAGRRTANLNYLDPGSVTVNGRVVDPRGLTVPIADDAFVVIATKDGLISVDELAGDVSGHPDYTPGQDIVLLVCGAGTRETQPGTFVPTSYARALGDKLGSRVHAVDGRVWLGDTIVLQGPAVTELPGLPLTDISGGTSRPQVNHDAQQAFWYGDRSNQIRVEEPFDQAAMARGAHVDGRPVDRMHLDAEEPDPMSLIDRAVDLVPFTQTNPLRAMKLVEPQLTISPDYNNLGLAGMTDKWLQEIADGSRMAYVIYPSSGSRLPREPVGIISVHKEGLVRGDYRELRPDVYEAEANSTALNQLRNSDPAKLARELLKDENYKPPTRQLPVGRKLDGTQEPGLTRAQLEDLGEVWQFSTYLVTKLTSGKSAIFPSGMVNKPARMKLMTLVAEESLRRGEGIPAFYSRIHAGGAYPVAGDGVQIVLDSKGAAQLISPDDTFQFTDGRDGTRRIVWNDVTRTISPDDDALYLTNPATHPAEFNAASIGSQQSLTDSGPIAIGLEDSSPFPGQVRRFVAIFKVDPGHHVRVDESGNVVLDGPGAKKWLRDVQGKLTEDEGTNKWSAPENPPLIYTSGKDPGEFTYTTLADFRDGKPIPHSQDPSALNPTIYLEPGAPPPEYLNLDGVNVVHLDGEGGPIQPAVAKRNPVPEYWQDGLTPEKAYARYLREKEYYTPQEMAERYGPEGLQPPRKIPDWRVGTTIRTRMNLGGGFGFGSIPFGSPTLRSRSFGLSLRSSFRALGQAARLGIEQRTLRPLKITAQREASLAVRPDEWRQTTAAQWGVLPASNWTILPVFGKDLIALAKKAFFGTPEAGWNVDIHSARVVGVPPRKIITAGESGATTVEVVNVSTLPFSESMPESWGGHVVEIEFHLEISAPVKKLAPGEMDFFGRTADEVPNGHVELQSSIPYDRVMQDIRVAPYLPGLTRLLNLWLHTKGIPTFDIGGESITFTPGGERRQQILMNDSVGKGDVVPTELPEQFNATSSGSTIKLQVVIKPGDPEATYVSDFLENPTVEGLRTLVEKGYVDPEQAKFFLPEHGSNFHQTAIPGKPLTTTVTDLTGRTFDAPDPATSNLWMIFNDRWSLGSWRFSPEQAAARGLYWAKQKIGGILPGNGPRRVASPHQLPVDGNILDAWYGANRDRADPSYRRTVLFGLPYFRYGPMAYNAEIRFQAGSDAPPVAPAVRDAGMLTYPLSRDGSGAAEVPAWFVQCIDQVLGGATPVIPKGGTNQVHTFLTNVESAYSGQSASVALFRGRFMRTGIIGDGKYLRRADARAMVEVLPGLRMDGGDPPGRTRLALPPGPQDSGPGGPRTLADNPPGGWEPVFNSQGTHSEGDDPSVGPPADGPLSLSAAYHPAEPPPGEQVSLTGLPEWARLHTDAFLPYDTVAMHNSASHWNLEAMEAKLTALGVSPATARRLVTQLGDGVESRVVQLVDFNEAGAREVFARLEEGEGLLYSPEYKAGGAAGMTQKWLREIDEGSRYAFIIYAAPGAKLPKEPIGIIALHKEPLINDGSYIRTLPASEYEGRRPAGEMSRSDLEDLGVVWQSSAYLVQSTKDKPVSFASNNPFPAGVVNKASRTRMLFALAERGERIPFIYARVHAGPTHYNVRSLGTQESFSAEGPIALVRESKSPYPGPTDERNVAIFRTDADRFLTYDGESPMIDGDGAFQWRSDILGRIGQSESGDWLGSHIALADTRPASIRWPEGWEQTSGFQVHQDDNAPSTGQPDAPSTLPRRVPGDPFPDVGNRVDPEFSTKLVNYIRSQDGISFADYMNLALYGIDGQGGYYNSGIVRIGDPAVSDFITAPETSKYFGRTIAEPIVQMYDSMGRPSHFDIVEMGAGNGVLARDILDKLQTDYPNLYQAAHYVIVERSEALIGRQQATLAGHPQVQWVHAGADAMPLRNVRGVFLSNELVDVFPVHRAVVRGGQFKEIYVTVDAQGRLVETERQPSPELAAALPDFEELFPRSTLREGQELTINATSIEWLRTLSGALDEGYVITMDYGEPAATVSTPPYVKYGAYTLEAKTAYKYPGAIDITSHVDFAVLLEIGERFGLRQATSIGGKWLYRQTEFLEKYGVRAALARETDPGEKASGNGLLDRFSDGFYVLVQEKRGAATAEAESPIGDDAGPQSLSAAYHPENPNPGLNLTPAEQRASRLQTLNAFVDANLLYSPATRSEIPTISVAVADPGHFSAFGRIMTPREFLLHDETHRNWLGNDAHGPLVLDIVNPSPAAIALAQRLSNVSGADIVVPMADAPTQWRILRPAYGGEHPSGTVELSADGTLVLVQGTERRAIQPDDLGQLLGVGVSKTAFRLYDKVLVIHRQDSNPNIVNTNNPIDRQIDAVNMLRRWGAPYIANTAGRTKMFGLDATLMDFYPGHSIEAGHEMPSGEMFYTTDVSLINGNSLSSLREMRDFYTRMGIGVDDPQFMMDRNGFFYLNDFSWILPSNTNLLASIDRWIEVAEAVMQRRQNPGSLPH